MEKRTPDYDRLLSNKKLQEIRDLWTDVKKEITTTNLKLIRAVESMDKYLY